MSEELSLKDLETMHAIRGLIKLEQEGDYVPAFVELGPYTAFAVVAAIQLAWRHPELPETIRRHIRQVGEQLSGVFGPPLDQVIANGWDTTKDRG